MKSKEEIEQLAEKSAQKKYRLQHIPLEQIDEYGGEIASHVSIFSDAYTQCQNDMADKKYTEREVVIMLQDCAIHFGIMNKSKDDGTFTTQIDKWVKNKLNKQD